MLTTTEAPSNVSVLILNTYNSSNIPVLANLNGNINLNLSFEIENNVDVYHSCGVQFQGNFYVYGSSVYTGRNTQIAMISDCALKRIATLPFTHEQGACAVGFDKLFLCFDMRRGNGRNCYESNQPTGPFDQVRYSTEKHWYSRVAANSGEYFCHSKKH